MILVRKGSTAPLPNLFKKSTAPERVTLRDPFGGGGRFAQDCGEHTLLFV